MGYPRSNSCCDDSGLSSLILTLQQQIANLAGQVAQVSHSVIVTQTVLATNPAGVLSGQVKIVTTGTAVPIPSNTLLNGISIFANPNNAGTINIGPLGVTNAADGTGNGDVIQPGAARAFGVSNSSAIYINGTAGDWISWSGN